MSDSDISYIFSHLCRNVAFSAGFHLLHLLYPSILRFCESVAQHNYPFTWRPHALEMPEAEWSWAVSQQLFSADRLCVDCVFGDGSVEASQLSAELANATNAIQESISMTWKFEFRLSASRRRMIRV